MPLKALEGVRRALSHPDTSRWGYFILAVGLFVLVVVIALVIVSQWRKSKRLKAAWIRLGRDMARWHLDRSQQDLVRELINREAPARPLDMVERLDVFEKAVHRYMASVGALEKNGTAARRAAARVAGLREKLDFTQARGRVYYSTREMAPGQTVHLARKGQAGRVSAWARVVGGEDVLALEDMQPPDPALRGEALEVVFFDGKAAFSFDSTVLALDEDKATCRVAHSIDVRSAGSREFHRVELNRPVAFRAAWEGTEVRREGTLRDIGAGGLALVSPCYYEDDEEILLHFQPAVYLNKPDAAGHSHLADRQIKGVILQTRRTADGRCTHHVEFRDLSSEDREYLFRLVRRIELDSGD